MNTQNQRQNSINQDSTTVLQNKVNTPVKVDSIKVSAPVLKTIPETPERFTQKKIIRPKKKILHTPNAEDSLRFNLITRDKNEEGIFNNTVVKDFLNPVKLSGKQWLIETSNYTLNTALPDVDTLKLTEPNSAKYQTITSTDTLASADSTFNLTTGLTADSIAASDEIVLVEPEELIEELLETEDLPIDATFTQSHQKDILSGILLLSVAILGVLRMTNNKYLRDLFSATIYSVEARKMQKTVNLRNQKHAVVLNFLFFLNISVFIYQLFSYYKTETIISQSLLLIPATMGIIVVFGGIKSLIYRFIAFVFETETETKEYLFYSQIYNKVFAILILPIIVVVPYIDVEVLPALFKIGIGIYIFLYLVQIFRGMGIILNNPASLFYMFLYLCALEILPLIVAYNILVK